jgi:hypothetical protein
MTSSTTNIGNQCQSSEQLQFPSICIPFSKIRYGMHGEHEVDAEFVKKCFSRYGLIERVIIKTHCVTNPHLSCSSYPNYDSETGTRGWSSTPVGKDEIEKYYSIVIHFKSWNIENKEAKYVRSVLMLPDEFSNLKLVYYGPWYWKFFAFKNKYVKR